jgi:glycosyltransferase involved in cell wall biosynthesis
VHDLARGQAELGLEVGIVCDSGTGGKETEAALSRLGDTCALGVTRLPMGRQLGFSDWRNYVTVTRLAVNLGINVLHGHGAKGGAYARLAARAVKRKGREVRAFYTPHGGSLHYSRMTPMGRLYIAAEQRLAGLTDGLIFESVFAARRYNELIGVPSCPVRVIPNGLYPYEFYEPILADDAADFVFVGELRQLKGVDLLLTALAAQATTYPARAIIVGSGPDEEKFKRLARSLRLGTKVNFPGPQPARSAFARGRCVVVPSRAESFPYIVLEAAAARMPLIATDVGGVPEIVAGTSTSLVQAGNADALAAQMRAFLADPYPFLNRAVELQAHVAERFTVQSMTVGVVDFYLTEIEALRSKAAPFTATAA